MSSPLRSTSRCRQGWKVRPGRPRQPSFPSPLPTGYSPLELESRRQIEVRRADGARSSAVPGPKQADLHSHNNGRPSPAGVALEGQVPEPLAGENKVGIVRVVQPHAGADL